MPSAMKDRRTPLVIGSLFFLFTFLCVAVASPAFSSTCGAGQNCLTNAVVELQRDDGLQTNQLRGVLLATTGDCPSSFEERVILLINVERSIAGVAPLTLDIQLQAAARWMSDDMADQDTIPENHIGSDGSTPRDRMLREGYVPSFLGGPENIAGGFTTPDSVVAAWMGSQGHKDNILNPIFEHLGVGYTYQDMPFFDHYWTVDFGATDDPRDPPLSYCDPGFYQTQFPIVLK